MNKRWAIALLVVATLLPISAFSEESNSVANRLPYFKNINYDVQLKDNGWIKILAEDAYVLTPEQFYASFIDDKSKIEEYSKTRREYTKHLSIEENYRLIYVKIQFLNYCRASIDKDEEERLGREHDEMWDRNVKNPNKKPEKQFDVMSYMDAITPRFRCNYRTTLMTSFFSPTGEEMQTEKNIPIAQWVSNKKRKVEMIPGETMTITVTIPDKAKYWYVWVPK